MLSHFVLALFKLSTAALNNDSIMKTFTIALAIFVAAASAFPSEDPDKKTEDAVKEKPENEAKDEAKDEKPAVAVKEKGVKEVKEVKSEDTDAKKKGKPAGECVTSADATTKYEAIIARFDAIDANLGIKPKVPAAVNGTAPVVATKDKDPVAETKEKVDEAAEPKKEDVKKDEAAADK